MSRSLPFARSDRFSSGELRRLRELRELVRVESARLPGPVLRDVLAILEGARPWRIPAPPIPEMTRAELLRAVRWRLGTVPLAGAQAASAFIVRHRQRAARAGARAADRRKRR